MGLTSLTTVYDNTGYYTSSTVLLIVGLRFISCTPDIIPIPDPTRRSFNLLYSCVKLIPDTHTHSRPDAFRPSLFCVKSIPDVSSVSRLRSGEARSRTSLARCVLVRLSSLSIYMFLSCPLYVPLSHHSLPSVRFLCLILSSPSPSTLVSSIFIPYLRRPSLVIPYIFLRPIPNRSDQPDPYHTHTCINTLVTRCCSSV